LKSYKNLISANKLKTIYTIFCLFVLCSCNNTKIEPITLKDSMQSNRILIPTYNALLPNKKFDSIVLAFVKENPCDSCIDEMYIDKVYPRETLITLKQRVYNIEYLKKQNPLFIIKYGQKQFFVYSGLEDIFIGDKKSMPYNYKDANNKNFVKWGITIDSNKYIVNKKYEGQPFFPQPKQNDIPKISGIKIIK